MLYIVMYPLKFYTFSEILIKDTYWIYVKLKNIGVDNIEKSPHNYARPNFNLIELNKDEC